jgi:hypothetical protein
MEKLASFPFGRRIVTCSAKAPLTNASSEALTPAWAQAPVVKPVLIGSPEISFYDSVFKSVTSFFPSLQRIGPRISHDFHCLVIFVDFALFACYIIEV